MQPSVSLNELGTLWIKNKLEGNSFLNSKIVDCLVDENKKGNLSIADFTNFLFMLNAHEDPKMMDILQHKVVTTGEEVTISKKTELKMTSLGNALSKNCLDKYKRQYQENLSKGDAEANRQILQKLLKSGISANQVVTFIVDNEVPTTHHANFAAAFKETKGCEFEPLYEKAFQFAELKKYIKEKYPQEPGMDEFLACQSMEELDNKHAPFIFAIYKNDIYLIDLLIKLGANKNNTLSRPNDAGQMVTLSPIPFSLNTDHHGLTEKLLARGFVLDETSLIALASVPPKVIVTLLEKSLAELRKSGKDQSFLQSMLPLLLNPKICKEAKEIIVKNCHLPFHYVVGTKIKTPEDREKLHKLLDFLVKAGVDPSRTDAQGNNALAIYCNRADPKEATVKKMIESGFDLHAKNKEGFSAAQLLLRVRQSNKVFEISLIHPFYTGKTIAEYFKGHESEVQDCAKMLTALDLAIPRQMEILNFLVAHGVDIDTPDQFSQTVLCNACSNPRFTTEHPDLIRQLIILGADPNYRPELRAEYLDRGRTKNLAITPKKLIERQIEKNIKILEREATPPEQIKEVKQENKELTGLLEFIAASAEKRLSMLESKESPFEQAFAANRDEWTAITDPNDFSGLQKVLIDLMNIEGITPKQFHDELIARNVTDYYNFLLFKSYVTPAIEKFIEKHTGQKGNIAEFFKNQGEYATTMQNANTTTTTTTTTPVIPESETTATTTDIDLLKQQALAKNRADYEALETDADGHLTGEAALKANELLWGVINMPHITGPELFAILKERTVEDAQHHTMLWEGKITKKAKAIEEKFGAPIDVFFELKGNTAQYVRDKKVDEIVAMQREIHMVDAQREVLDVFETEFNKLSNEYKKGSYVVLHARPNKEGGEVIPPTVVSQEELSYRCGFGSKGWFGGYNKSDLQKNVEASLALDENGAHTGFIWINTFSTVNRSIPNYEKEAIEMVDPLNPAAPPETFPNIGFYYQYCKLAYFVNKMPKGKEKDLWIAKLHKAIKDPNYQSPHDAYEFGRQRVPGYNADEWKKDGKDLIAMRSCLRAKFTQNPLLLAELVTTAKDSRPLVQMDSDGYWGSGNDGKGQNHLGRCLMAVRDDMIEGRETPAFRL